MPTEQKTIILGMPADNQIYRVIEAALDHHGFNVVSVVMDNLNFRYPSFSCRLKIKFRQLVLRDKNAKKDFKSAQLIRDVENKLAAHGKADYALFIRGDIYSPEFLDMIKRHTRHGNMVNYQWDGIDRFPAIWDCADRFDRIYVFDPADMRNPKHPFLSITNFYFDHDVNLPENPPNDFYFIGWHMPDRAPIISAFGKAAETLGWKLDFNIGCLNTDVDTLRRFYPTENIKIFIGVRSFADNLEAAKQAKILIDFKTPVHNGLSFRPFEALGYRKKLITTNAEIKKYDFYHPDNVFVWDGKSLDGLAEFVAKPYRELPPEIYQKYSFGNWLRYILDIPPHQKITLPE